MKFEDLILHIGEKTGVKIPEKCFTLSEPLHSSSVFLSLASFLMLQDKTRPEAVGFIEAARNTLDKMTQVGLIDKAVLEYLDQAHSEVKETVNKYNYSKASQQIDNIGITLELVREMLIIDCYEKTA